jgi:hypothetical protein
MPKKNPEVKDDKEVKAKKTTVKKTAAKDTKTASKTTKKAATTKSTASKTASKTTSKKADTTAKKTTKEAAPKATAKAEPAKKTRKTSVSKTVEKKVKAEEAEIKKIVNDEVKPKESDIIKKIKEFLLKVSKLQDEEKKKEQKAKTKVEKEEKKDIEAEKKLTYNIEYYDLPYRYNETVVKILAQTPKRLFVYWDISDNDRERFVATFGDNFFNDTYPILLIHNEEKNYTFEIPINDFANSWYLDIPDPKSKYTIQLGRKFKYKDDINYVLAESQNIIVQNDYLPITTSNTLEVPNDHILFENMKPYVVYRNVKNYQETIINISNLDFARRMGRIYNIYDIYKNIYKNELGNDGLLRIMNPSSMSSSKMNSSYFK